MDLRTRIDSTRMGYYQWLIVTLALFINALDGYDTVAMAFSATAVSAEFGLAGAGLGWLLSSALIGIGIGSLLLAPRADTHGRRRLILFALLIDLAGLPLTALAPTYALLLASRVLTGIGVGAILACITVVVSEFSNRAHRGLAIAIFASGYGLGSAACGAIAKTYGPVFGWQITFWVGAALTAIALALAAAFLPESPDFLATRRDLPALRALAARLGKDPQLQLADAPSTSRVPFRAILAPGLRRVTIQLWAAFSLITFTFTFANQWTPKLLTTAGLSADQGIIGGILLSFGGTVGSILFGVLSTRVRAVPLLIGTALVSAGVLVAFIATTSYPLLMFGFGTAVGLLLNGCVTGLYTVTPAAYPAALRTTGVGSAIGVARVGAITAPTLAGYLLDAGWPPLALYSGAAAATVCAALALVGVRPWRGAGYADSSSATAKSASVTAATDSTVSPAATSTSVRPSAASTVKTP